MTRTPFILFMAILTVGCVPFRSHVSMANPVTEPVMEKVSQPNEERAANLIRVAVVVRHPSVQLIIPSQFNLIGISQSNSKVIYRDGKEFISFEATVHDLEGASAFIRPGEGEGEVEIDGNRYKGAIQLIQENGGYITVINELSFEEYVMGVLAGEIPGSWPMEALKAQAIAARTFALYKQNQAKKISQPYDIENTALAQMYIGSRLVNQSIRQAVMETEGEILTYQDEPIMAVFHSNCGGETTSAVDVWGQDKPYLRSVSCDFGNQGPHYKWKETLKVSDVVGKLRAANIPIYDIVQISSIEKDNSHRVIKLVLMDGDGRKKQVKGAVFRMALGPDVVRSTRFDVQLDGDEMEFTGLGWGHGVGLCQEGAYGMAKEGYGAFDILRHYYYGVILDKIKNE
jgi:stage II sporulation protein D